jgi:hypothetical protein
LENLPQQQGSNHKNESQRKILKYLKSHPHLPNSLSTPADKSPFVTQPTNHISGTERQREREREVTRSAKRFSLFLFLNSANWNSSCREPDKMLQGLHPSNLRNLQTEQKTCNRWGTTSCLKTYSETRKHILHFVQSLMLCILNPPLCPELCI